MSELGYFFFDSHVTREVLNGMWFVLSICLVVVFATFLLSRIRRGGFWSIYDEPALQAAVALLIVFIGSMFRSGYVWIILRCENGGSNCDHIRSLYWVLFIALALKIVGTLCCIRIFSPRRLLPWSWIGAGVLALLAPTLLIYLD